ncbi:hypothetical protein AAF712_009714 [Marasmius tenuissimus]|uniref:Uncharacterized protein n=1 Tax=Marasmius tenuissimus TaxID=585030 RepID=A0ABR2ZP27_9AGAR
MKTPHTKASRELLKQRLTQDRDHRLNYDSPSRDIFQKMSSYVTALQRLGCRMQVEGEQRTGDSFLTKHHKQLQRGYVDKVTRCSGKVVFSFDWAGHPSVSCEYYDSHNSHLHFHQRLDDSYHNEYIKAVLTGDLDTARAIEEEADIEHNVGPARTCNIVTNHSAQRFNCPHSHRDPETGDLYQPLMEHLKCDVKFKIYEPLEDYREDCPYVLVIVQGVHCHPIPLPNKTPPKLHSRIFDILRNVGEDLTDLTARGLIRHPVVHSHVQALFPNDPLASISDIHVSLANHAHIASYIKQAKKEVFPMGTGWEGALHLQKCHLERYGEDDQYIRSIIHVPVDQMQDDSDDGCTDDLRIILCMSKEGSQWLIQSGQYLQSDISFKRLNGWKEFIIAGRDRDANAAVVYCRVYVTRETAFAHFRIFQEIEKTVKEDTRRPIPWRHIYAPSNDESDQQGLVLMWTGDQHGGQAKGTAHIQATRMMLTQPIGLGLHLQSICQSLDGRDLYENKRLKDLSPYDHLHRIFRLCLVHFCWNIQECKVPPPACEAMRGLACMEHESWDEALETIRNDGGRAGVDWLENKIQSKFALEAVCWEKSKIPKYIWMASDRNDNIVESSHSNVNLEGKSCTLVGGIEKGRRYDATKLAKLRSFEEAGVRPSYATGHQVDNSCRAIKRKNNKDHRMINKEDDQILKHNTKVQKAYDKFTSAQTRGNALYAKLKRVVELGKPMEEIHEARRKMTEHREKWNKMKDELVKISGSATELKKGSGKYIPIVFQDS